MSDIIYYTDGACKGNPGPGGCGAVRIERNIEGNYSYIADKYSCYSENTTNNREELKAIIYVLKIASQNKDDKFIIYSDSAYAVNMINNWIWGWSKNGWQNSKKREVENINLVKEIYKYINTENFNCQIMKVAGHCGCVGNELADALATNNLVKFEKVCNTNNIKETNHNEIIMEYGLW